jgi:hypothetical protein
MTVPVTQPERRISGTRLRAGQEEMNGFMRGFAAERLAPTDTQRQMREFDAREAALDAKAAGIDQGSRGAAHEPEAPQDANSWMRQAFREGREGNG